jgi:hypothetical protein
MVRDEDTDEFAEPSGGSERRPRTATTIAVVVAALAVVAAVIWSTFRGPDGGPGPGSTTAPSPISASPSTSTSPVTVSPSTPGVAPTGNADGPARSVTVDPKGPIVASDVPYLVDRTLRAGMRTVSYTFDPPFAYAPLAGGRAVIVESNVGTSSGDRAQLTDADGGPVATVQAAPEHVLWAVANDAGTRFALLDVKVNAQDNAGVLRLYDDKGARLATRTGVVEAMRPAGFVGSRLFLGNHRQGGSLVWDTDRNTISRYAEKLVVVSTSESSGRAAFTELADYEKPRCATVADVRGARPLPVSSTCGLFSATELSDDGRHLLGFRVPSDGSLQAPSRVIDVATGRPLVYFESEPTTIQARFLADGSVGMNTYVATGGSPGNTIVRCTLEGACARVVEPLPMPDYDQTLATRYWLVPQ